MDQMEPIAQRPEVVSNSPTQFDLRGKDIHVSFSTTSITGRPLLQYRDRRRQVSASGDEIRQVDVGIGTLVTIELQSNAADAGGILFSVLIPHAQLIGRDRGVKIRTVGITTRTPGFVIPTTRQVETYTEVNLTGEATLVFS
jgi:hypothetical protein